MSLISFLLLIGSLIGIAVILSAFARNTWIGTLAVQFAPFYGILLLLIFISYLALGTYEYLFSSGLLLGLSLFEVLSRIRWNRPAAADTIEGKDSLKIFLANVNADNKNVQTLVNSITESRSELVILLEVSPEMNSLLEKACSDDWEHCSYHIYRGEKFGLKVMSSFRLSDVVCNSDQEAPAAPQFLGSLYLPLTSLRLVILHPLSPERRSWMPLRRKGIVRGGEIAREAREKGEQVILLGDLNATPWDPLFGDLLRISGLRDARRGFGYIGTWPTLLPPAMIPLDHVLVSEGITVRQFRRGKRVGSDHWPVEVDLKL